MVADRRAGRAPCTEATDCEEATEAASEEASWAELAPEARMHAFAPLAAALDLVPEGVSSGPSRT